jgi:UDP-N-acetylglucosamine transferase subunit ALG13
MKPKVFVSFGTHEQAFTRLYFLVKQLSELRSINLVIQNGFTQIDAIDEVPHADIMTHEDFTANVNNCDVFITQSSPGNLFGALEVGKIPLLVPRLSQNKEHVDSHQEAFAEYAKSFGLGIHVRDFDELLEGYDELLKIGKDGQKARAQKIMRDSKLRTTRFNESFSLFLREEF